MRYTPDDIDFWKDERESLRWMSKNVDSLHRKMCLQLDALSISIELYVIGVYE